MSRVANGFVKPSGPKNVRHRGLVQIERGGGSMLAITVISPCYTGRRPGRIRISVGG